MVVVDDAAVGADGDIYARSLEIFVSCLADIDKSRRLTSADTLCFAGDTYRSAADADLYEVRTRLGEEEEALSVNYVARADLDAVAVVLSDPCEGAGLPLREALGGVDAENVCARLDKCGNTLSVVSCVYTCADNVALVRVEKLVGVVLMGIIVLAENKISELALGVDYGQGVELVVPNYVVCFLEGGAVGGGDELFAGSHERRNLFVSGHAADAVVSARDYADKFAVCRAVLGHGDSGMAVSFLERDNVVESRVGSDVRVTDDEARLEILRSCDHCRLVLDALGAEDERYAAFFCERHGELLAGDGLHNGGSQRNVE